MAPNSTVGDKALWKKNKNIAKKKSASEIINNATPIFIPLLQQAYGYLSMFLRLLRL